MKKLVRRELKEKYKERKVKVRDAQKQREYRQDLIDLHGKCQICGLENEALLIASHIKPYSKSKEDQAIDFNNGFLLCAIHDKLFDNGFITFDDEGNVIISSELNFNDREILKGIEEIKIDIDKNQKKYLKWHRKNVFRK